MKISCLFCVLCHVLSKCMEFPVNPNNRIFSNSKAQKKKYSVVQKTCDLNFPKIEFLNQMILTGVFYVFYVIQRHFAGFMSNKPPGWTPPPTPPGSVTLPYIRRLSCPVPSHNNNNDGHMTHISCSRSLVKQVRLNWGSWLLIGLLFSLLSSLMNMVVCFTWRPRCHDLRPGW